MIKKLDYWLLRLPVIKYAYCFARPYFYGDAYGITLYENCEGVVRVRGGGQVRIRRNDWRTRARYEAESFERRHAASLEAIQYRHEH